jgi:hypothetical protein
MTESAEKRKQEIDEMRKKEELETRNSKPIRSEGILNYAGDKSRRSFAFH